MHEVSYEVSVRTEATMAAVWAEMCRLDRLLGHLPGISSVELADGSNGSFAFVLSRFGRVWKRVDARVTVTEVVAPRSLRWLLEMPSMDWDFEGVFELSPVGTGETALTYRGTMRFPDRYAGPLQPIHAEVLEEHLETLATRIAGRAARHTLAERMLGQG